MTMIGTAMDALRATVAKARGLSGRLTGSHSAARRPRLGLAAATPPPPSSPRFAVCVCVAASPRTLRLPA